MRFRAKATLSIAVVTAVALGGAFSAVSAAFNDLQQRQLEGSLLKVAEGEAAEAASNGFTFSDRPGPPTNDIGPLTKYGVIYDESGKVLAATPPFDKAPPLSSLGHPHGEAFDISFGKELLRAISVPIPGHPDKAVLVATSRADLDGDERFLLDAMAVAFVVAVAWAAAVAAWLSDWLTRDRHSIADVARSVAAGDLSARVRLHSRDPELDQLGRDINDMVDRLAELLASQQRFIAHAAHELRSPLAALYGELQQSLRKPRDAQGYRAAIEAALASTTRLKVLAEDLLTLAHTKGDASSPFDQKPVEAVLQEARSYVEELARERGVKLAFQVSGSSAVADRNGDTSRLIRNLLENAIRHSSRGDVVSVQATLLHGSVRVLVADEGPGIERSDRESIFEPFFRGRGAKAGGGAGLGLGIAREIARAHGGDIVLDDADPDRRGARFIVSLPRLEEAPARPSNEPEAHRISEVRSSASDNEREQIAPSRNL